MRVNETPAPRPADGWLAGSSERRLELRDQIVHVFDADRQADEPIADAKIRAHLRWQRRMGHDGRVLDEALDATETLGECEELAALEKTARRRETALQHRRDHAAVAALHLPVGEGFLRMAREPRVVHPLHLSMAFEELRHGHCVRAVALHAKRERLDSSQ